MDDDTEITEKRRRSFKAQLTTLNTQSSSPAPSRKDEGLHSVNGAPPRLTGDAAPQPTINAGPRPVRAFPHRSRPLTPSEQLQLPPMPALEELKPIRSHKDALAEYPTIPLRPGADISRYPTMPLRRPALIPARPFGGPGVIIDRTKLPGVSQATVAIKPLRDMPRVPGYTRLKRLRKKRRPHRRLFVILTLLFSIGCLLASVLYALEADVLSPLAQFFHPVGETSSLDGRAWNLLLLGSDNDQKFTFPEILTQVMMVVHVDPLNKSAFLLSIPRDSWVSVPGQSEKYKIDQAFDVGASAKDNFDDGVRLARQTVEQDYGIPIDRYAWIGLDGFASVINTLGGVDIDVVHPIFDDSYPDDASKSGDPYAVKRLDLAPGPQHLDGEQALEYVRSRHADLVGDIGRTQRQQEILEALQKKLNVSTVFDHLSDLFHDLSGKVYTDLSESEMFSLANFARDLPASSVGHLTLGPGAGTQNFGSYSTITSATPGFDGDQQVILPNCATIQPAVNQIFGLGDVQSCQVGGSS